MSGNDFLRVVQEAFTPFLTGLGFQPEGSSVSGRYYRASFVGSSHAVWVTYEPGDEACLVVVFTRTKRGLSDFDDSARTFRLSELNRRYMAETDPRERADGEAFFKQIDIHDVQDQLLLKAAKELRLVLPRFLRDAGRR